MKYSMNDFYNESCILPPILLQHASSSNNTVSSHNTSISATLINNACPQQSNRLSQLSTSQRRSKENESKSRVGWWDPKADKSLQMQKIKDLVRNSQNDKLQKVSNATISPILERESIIKDECITKKVDIGIQAQIESVYDNMAQQERLIQKISNLSDLTRNVDIQKDIILIKYLQDKKCEDALQSLHKDLRMPWTLYNQIRLTCYLNKLDFRNALLFIENTIQKMFTHSKPDRQISLLIASYDDLVYVLCKYRYLHLCHLKQFEVASETLKDLLWPIVEKEQLKGGIRGKWFLSDYELLQEITQQDSSYSHNNMYKNLDWNVELNRFWIPVKDLAKKNPSASPPLYAHIVLKCFWYESSLKEDYNLDLDCVLQDHIRWKEALKHLSIVNDKSITKLDSNPAVNPNNRISPPKSPKLKSASSGRRLRVKGCTPSTTTLTSQDEKWSIQSFQKDGSIALPISKESETADFALSTTCGPVVSYIRCLDSIYVSHLQKVIVATAGGDRMDRCISIWDIKAGTLCKRLDNGSSKNVALLLFHPITSCHLISADMEFDVKLWDWEKGEILKVWRKHHSRIIYKIDLIPGTTDTFASCSGDQSLKIWNIYDPQVAVRSVHANEPITSFIFCGSPTDPLQQKLIVSLSYSIRIYKLRTLGILHSISLHELKANKTPISFMHLHPSLDQFVLLSCDNQLKLYDLINESTVKTYTTRHIENGTRMEGKFSPYGNYIYSGSCDVRGYNYTCVKDELKENSDSFGMFIWKTSSGKLEIDEIKAMKNTSPVFGSLWYFYFYFDMYLWKKDTDSIS